MPNSKVFSLCEKFQFKELVLFLETKYDTTKNKDFLIINWDNWVWFIFDYWVFINWWLDKNIQESLLKDISWFQIKSNVWNLIEEYNFSESSWKKLTINNDTIVLFWDTIQEKLAISFCLWQSIKLNHFEQKVENKINETKNIPHNLASTWNTKLSSLKISKMRWELFLVTSDINLHFDFLDDPDLIWEKPELENTFKIASSYFEIKHRTDILNKKLQVIHELFDMLADEQKHSHSSLLEWIIIWLIAVEIFFTVFHDVLKWF